MKTLPVVLLQCLTILTSASAQEAFIYTYDLRPRSSSRPNTIAPETAYSIWNRRMGLPENRQLSSVEASVLEEIDLFGGRQPLLLESTQEQNKPSRLSIIVQGFNDDVARLDQEPNLTIPASSELARCLKTKREDTEGRGRRTFNWTFATEEKLNVFFEVRLAEPNNGVRTEQLESLLWSAASGNERLRNLLSMLNLDRFSVDGNRVEVAFLQLDYTGMVDTAPRKRYAMISELLSYLNPRLASFASSGSQESTIVLLPTTASLSKSLPKQEHVARQASEEDEETLSIPSFPQLSTMQSNSSNSSGPPKLAPGTFLPTCFNSESACANATNNCSGHGSCSKKHSGCYACSCARTIVRYNDDGTTKSVQWGGAACEKKDISVEFWLFAGFAIAMTAMVAGTIGMLYSMGAEELPSVIGAGVAGPRAK